VRLRRGENHTRCIFYQKLTMCCWGRRRERVHCKKSVSILDGVCDISSKIWVGGWLGRTILMTLTRPSVAVVVHYYLRWVRWSAAHSRRGATARVVMRSSTREHPGRSKFARLASPGVTVRWYARVCYVLKKVLECSQSSIPNATYQSVLSPHP